MANLTKLDIIRLAYAECGKADYEFDLQPEDLQSALMLLDSMLAMWSGTQGIRIGYAGGEGDGSLDVRAEVPMWAAEALYLNLALRLAPGFGKTLSPLTLVNAKAALDAVRVRTSVPLPRKLSGYAGAGNSMWGAAQMPRETPAIATGPDNTLTIGVAE